jgi:hypothetical protein
MPGLRIPCQDKTWRYRNIIDGATDPIFFGDLIGPDCLSIHFTSSTFSYVPILRLSYRYCCRWLLLPTNSKIKWAKQNLAERHQKNVAVQETCIYPRYKGQVQGAARVVYMSGCTIRCCRCQINFQKNRSIASKKCNLKKRPQNPIIHNAFLEMVFSLLLIIIIPL